MDLSNEFHVIRTMVQSMHFN